MSDEDRPALRLVPSGTDRQRCSQPGRATEALDLFHYPPASRSLLCVRSAALGPLLHLGLIEAQHPIKLPKRDQLSTDQPANMFLGRVVAGGHLSHGKAPGLGQCPLRVIVVKIGCFTSGVLVPTDDSG